MPCASLSIIRLPLKLSLAVALAILSAASAMSADPPNLLLVIADDLGTQLGCYGDATARTPHIDQLAAEGVRFDNGYVTAASCSPSRGSIFTGLFPHQHGMMGLSHFGTERMHDDVPKLPNELKKLGYATALIGKSHFKPFQPFAFDFYDENLSIIANDRDVMYMNRKAVEFLDGVGNQPFFLVMSYVDPHRGDADGKATYGAGKNLKFPRVKLGLPESPTPPEKVTPMPFLGLDSGDIRMEQADYYGAVDRLDIGIGDLRSRLEAMELWKDTLVVFIGDHGPDVTRGKMAVYESATRIPFLVRGPGATPGLVRKEFVSTIDLFPTFLKAAGSPQPVVDPRQYGQPLQPLLQPGNAPWRKQIFTEYITHVPWHFFPRYTIREDNWKLIHNLYGGKRENPLTPANYCFAWWESQKPEYDNTPIQSVYHRVEFPPEYELYNLSTDPYEMENLAANPQNAKTLEHLANSILSWRKESNDPFLNPLNLAAQQEKGEKYRKVYEQRHSHRAAE